MCVKIFHTDRASEYDSSIPLEEQIKNSKEVIINYDPKDKKIELFLREMERLVKTGISCNVSFRMSHNNNIRGASVKKQLIKLQKDLGVNEAIKILTTIHSELDRGLENISIFCQKR